MVLVALLSTISVSYSPASGSAHVELADRNGEYARELAFWEKRSHASRKRKTPLGVIEVRALKPRTRPSVDSSEAGGGQELVYEIRGPQRLPSRIRIETDWPYVSCKVDGREVDLGDGKPFQFQGMSRTLRKRTISLEGSQHEVIIIQHPGE